jgi:hypothetical protein
VVELPGEPPSAGASLPGEPRRRQALDPGEEATTTGTCLDLAGAAVLEPLCEHAVAVLEPRPSVRLLLLCRTARGRKMPMRFDSMQWHFGGNYDEIHG